MASSKSAPDAPGTSQHAILDLDALRGWREHRDPALNQPHELPALAYLHQLDSREVIQRTYPVHGLSILVGRFHSQHTPVDLLLDGLQDHQTYRLGSPHAQLERSPSGTWTLQALSTQAPTQLNQSRLAPLDTPQELQRSDVITFGVTSFRFEPLNLSLDAHQHSLQTLLSRCPHPALFLARAGAPCGPFIALDPKHPLTLGRSYPPPGTLPRSEQWPAIPEPFWDLSGLPDVERKFIAFQHARFSLIRERWHIEPLSTRQRTYVNRIPIHAPAALESGDEIGLGSALLHLQLPDQPSWPRRSITPPSPLDWSEGRPPSEEF
ncbi:hypothetical protein DL240_07120 [Lujinxingia litoralis]|uniref:FHA domain-containing protein n=1 Tax=Lujinxingia litoralis TaxID=2211119 RepID=A0A328CD56_9DELT|nr:FHA domain-containing protein [Lujinxingia litoralis]RAL23911.1 hypothetical protein DL240_07120 [Lujinxingia litoralis]